MVRFHSQVVVRKARVFHDPVLCARFHILVAVNGNDDSVRVSRFSKCVMATFDPDQRPAVLFQDTAHAFAGNGLHNSISCNSAVAESDSALPASAVTSSQSSAASRMLANASRSEERRVG